MNFFLRSPPLLSSAEKEFMQEEICMDGKRSLPPSRIGPVIFIAIQIGGFALLWGKDTPPPEYVYLPATTNKAATDTAPVSAPVVVISPPDEKALRKIIQAVLEQELAPYARLVATTASASQMLVPANPPGVKENSSENIEALNQITMTVSTALARGKWTNADNSAAQAYSYKLTESQKIKILDDVMGAINRQELNITEASPAF
jgi:hypothetical protein